MTQVHSGGANAAHYKAALYAALKGHKNTCSTTGPSKYTHQTSERAPVESLQADAIPGSAVEKTPMPPPVPERHCHGQCSYIVIRQHA